MISMSRTLDDSLHLEVDQLNTIPVFCFGLHVTEEIPQEVLGWDDKNLPKVLKARSFRIGLKLHFDKEQEEAVRKYLRAKTNYS